MKSPGLLITTYLALLLIVVSASAQSKKITAAEAKNHVGETQTVCGKVVSTHYATSSKGQPTFLNLDEPYPKEVFTILIWGSERAKFGKPEEKYRNNRVCVTGKITDFRGKAKIAATDPRQVEVQK
jgi:hypothetical protein